MKNQLSEKNILLGVTGSIAAYKACEIVRLITKAGGNVRVIMTANATRFIGPLTLETLSRNQVLTDTFGAHDSWVPEHISIAQWASLLLVAPATANIIAKAKAGIADDLLSSTLLSVKCPIVFAPAMNENMYTNNIVQESIQYLRDNGCHFIEPGVGFLADGYEGKGRLADPPDIIEHIARLLQ